MNSAIAGARAGSFGGTADTLFERLAPAASGVPSGLRLLFVAAAGSLLLTLSAKLNLPIGPVPISMQTFVVLALGLVLGPRLGVLVLVAYMAEGAMGLPVFAGTPAKGVGLAYMMGPTGGYLLGWFPAVVATGLLARRGWDRSFVGTLGAMFVGNAFIYAFGLLWLGTLIGWDKPVFALGMTPFLLGDLAKMLVAAALLPTLWRLIGRRGA